ncbi:putative metallophosphoesterase At3g03305 isoform X3 [Arachis ipaensis]|uniref:putative metallophosphoesterase At3g03305 isoform X3 n=1 Tax=Arachis ipaensis TaxID=130454 RepID=UPI000A2B60F2|nr:putative metallophosphoesterase At3g03305 isoform X3 [Arachis ipaensis]XP_025649653.1 putative metallophosphoesterase At3g03305 [Arachis hypogaea]
MNLLLLILCFISFYTPTTAGNGSKTEERVIQTKGVYDSVLWVVQFSDLHFSVHHPDRAIDFHDLVGPALSFINPSLVLITGDLTGQRLCEGKGSLYKIYSDFF